MTTRIEGRATEWWRADRYEVVHGTHIRPVANSAAEPNQILARYDESLIGAGRARDAYLGLLNLDLNDDGAVLAWCSSFGLLGILHHRLIAAYFWPTWERRLLGGVAQLKPHQIVLAEAESFYVFPKRVLINEVALSPVGAGPMNPGRPLSESEMWDAVDPANAFSLRRPHVLVRAIWSAEQDEVDTVEGYGQFFPHVNGIPAWTQQQAELHAKLPWAAPTRDHPQVSPLRPRAELNLAQYPWPDSPDFARLYAEPRYLFNQVVHGFQAAVGSLADQADEAPWIRAAVRLKGHWVPTELANALRQVSPSLAWTEDDGWVHAWQVRSLLAAMSVMVVQDLTLRGGRLPICAWCGERFFTDRGDRRYCKPACGNAFRVAKHRQKQESPVDN